MLKNSKKKYFLYIGAEPGMEYSGNCSISITESDDSFPDSFNHSQYIEKFASIDELALFIKEAVGKFEKVWNEELGVYTYALKKQKEERKMSKKETDEKLNKILNDMDRDGIMLCPFMDQQEQFCSDYRTEWKGYRGGICVCDSVCDRCNGKGKVWNDDLGVPTKTRIRQCKNCKDSIYKYHLKAKESGAEKE